MSATNRNVTWFDHVKMSHGDTSLWGGGGAGELLAESMVDVMPTFDVRGFMRVALRGIDELGWMERAAHIADALTGELPPHFHAASQRIVKSLGPELTATEGNGLAPFFYLPHSQWISRQTAADFDRSLAVCYELTKRFTAEFCIRPDLVEHQDETLTRLASWATDSNPHVRRLVNARWKRMQDGTLQLHAHNPGEGQDQGADGICQEMAAKGQFLTASPQLPVATGSTDRVREGQRLITAGPFTETTEQLGGYYLIDVENLDEAIVIAGRLPPAKKGTVEIRPLFKLDGLPTEKLTAEPAASETPLKKFMFLCDDDEEAWRNAGPEAHHSAMLEAVALTLRLDARGQYLSASPLHAIATATSVRVRNG